MEPFKNKTMNIITKSDKKKFIQLLKLGLKNGTQKNMTTYSGTTNHEGTLVVKEYYVSLDFRFLIDPEHIDKLIAEDFIENEIDDLLNDNP